MVNDHSVIHKAMTTLGKINRHSHKVLYKANIQHTSYIIVKHMIAH